MSAPEKRSQWLRLLGNSVNLSNLFGLAVARLGGCQIRHGPRGLYLADRYRFTFPIAGAFTIGNVLITSGDWDDLIARRPTLIEHEEAHTWQWLYCGGMPFLIGYGASMLWSWLRTGDRAARNVFERRAGLDLGGYLDVPVRPMRQSLGELRGLVVLRRAGRVGREGRGGQAAEPGRTER